MSDSEESVGADIEAAAEAAISTLLPAKSRAVYELSYQRFDQWLGLRKLECISEKVMLAYFMQRSKLLKPSTMWSEYSKLRTTIYLNKKVDISKFNNLILEETE
jgi:hypothetical protein